MLLLLGKMEVWTLEVHFVGGWIGLYWFNAPPSDTLNERMMSLDPK